jgi:broad specificity phosphatase PhoE
VTLALFVRHGKASAFGGGDYDELSAPGIEQSEHLGEWLAEQRVAVDAVFVGPRKRHAQTHDAVARVLAARGRGLPMAPVTPLPELDEHDGISLVFKLLPALAAWDSDLRSLVEATVRGEPPPSEDLLAAFKKITRGWVRGEIHHDDVEPWTAFRARVSRALARIAALGADKTALVFTSAGTVAAAVGESLEVRSDQRVLDLSWSVYNGSLTELDFVEERWHLRAFNGAAHLRERRLLTTI